MQRYAKFLIKQNKNVYTYKKNRNKEKSNTSVFRQTC